MQEIFSLYISSTVVLGKKASGSEEEYFINCNAPLAAKLPVCVLSIQIDLHQNHKRKPVNNVTAMVARERGKERIGEVV